MPSALSLRLDERFRAKGIDVVQGVGDTYWVWQKLVRHVEEMHFNILTTSDAQLQTRAIEFLKLLPKVGRIQAKRVTQADYDRVCACRTPVSDIIGARVSEYSVNRPLEIGVRLDAIDPETVEWTPGFKVDPAPVETYSILYVSGSKPDHTDVWTPQQWALLYRQLNNGDPPLLLGAPYDRWMLELVADALLKLGIRARVETQLNPADTIRHLRDASQFVGYQSGLNIIADAYDVPQVMVYFPHLKPMLYSWCKPGHAGSLFRAFTFDQTPEQVAHEC